MELGNLGDLMNVCRTLEKERCRMPCPASISKNQVDITHSSIVSPLHKKLTTQTFVTSKDGPPLPMVACWRRVAEFVDRHGDLC